jgi:hypothetical protein
MNTTESGQSATTAQRTAERRRRHLRIAAVITPAALAALVLGLGAAGQLGNSVAPPPPDHLLTLAAHPLLPEEWGNPVRPRAVPVPMSACVSSPLTWGAAESDAATYGRPGQPRFGNEFVLRFDSVAAAHRAVTDAWNQFRDCPTPRTVVTDPWGPPVSEGRWHLSESFTNERARFATVRDTRRNDVEPVAMYSLLVARRHNVVVAVETREVDDRGDVALSMAMARATADMPRERVLLSAIGGLDGW